MYIMLNWILGVVLAVAYYFLYAVSCYSIPFHLIKKSESTDSHNRNMAF